MNVIPSLIAAGPKSFLNVEYLYLAAHSVALSGDPTPGNRGGDDSFLYRRVLHLDVVRVDSTDHRQMERQGLAPVVDEPGEPRRGNPRRFCQWPDVGPRWGSRSLRIEKSVLSALRDLLDKFALSVLAILCSIIFSQDVLARSQCACPHVRIGCSSSTWDSY